MSEEVDWNKIVEIETLLNAQLYGEPKSGSIVGKIMGKYRELKPDPRKVNILVKEWVENVKSLSTEAIEKKLNQLDPNAIQEYLKKKEKRAEKREEQKRELPDLPNVIKGQFVVRYAPDPSKYPHLGQGMSYIINRIYADKYDGKTVLRFDDTNPTIVDPKYYKAIKDGMKWLGATWDEEIRASQFIDEFYETTFDLIIERHFFVCVCNSEDLKRNREHMVMCQHRKQDVTTNTDLFNQMIEGKFNPGEATVRLEGDMESDNPVMRDPIMLRIVKDQHPLLEKFYHVFPTYDFESAFLEVKAGITHVLRSGEFGTMRQELQSYIIKKLGGNPPEFVQFGRFNIQGCPTKGRVIRQLVEDKIVNGWDDIRLITLQGIMNRGLHPGTPRKLVEEAGLSPQNTNIAWTTVESISRQLLEPDAKRFFFVQDPVKINLSGNPSGKVEFDYHPDHPEYGKRKIKYSNEFYISSLDADKYNAEDIFRLKDLFNVKITNCNEVITGSFAGTDLISGTDKIQWVSSDYIPGTLIVPLTLEEKPGKLRDTSLYDIHGFFEPNIVNLKEDEVIQLERVGFAKVKIENNFVTGHIVHLY